MKQTNFASLKEITTKIGSGATPRGGQRAYKQSGITLIRSLNVYDFKFERDGLAFIDQKQAEKLSNVVVEPNDILLNITGASVARCCMVPSQVLPARVNQHVSIIRVNSELANPNYVLYCLNSYQYKHSLLTLAQGGSTREAITKEMISNFKIPLPPLPTQQKIAAILSAYDDLIENNNRRIEILEEMARMLYREWFVKFRYPGHESDRFYESELGLIPEGWEVVKLPEICSKVIDGTHDSPKPVEKGYYMVTGRHITNGFIDFSKCYFISEEEHEKVMKRSKPEKGDTVFSNIGTLGSTVLVDQDFEFSIKNVALFKPLKPVYSSLIYLHFSHPDTLEAMQKKASGTSQKFFSLKFLRDLDVIKPSDCWIKRFNATADTILNMRSLLSNKNNNLRQTRDLLLPRLISGEIDVENLDIKGVNN